MRTRSEDRMPGRLRPHIDYLCESCKFQSQSSRIARAHCRHTGHKVEEWRFGGV